MQHQGRRAITHKLVTAKYAASRPSSHHTQARYSQVCSSKAVELSHTSSLQPSMQQQGRRAITHKLVAAKYAASRPSSHHTQARCSQEYVNDDWRLSLLQGLRKSLTFYKNTINKDFCLNTATNPFKYLVFLQPRPLSKAEGVRHKRLPRPAELSNGASRAHRKTDAR